MSTLDIISIGKACSIVNAMPDEIRVIASQLGIKPAAHIDQREFFSRADLERIAIVLRSQAQADRALQHRQQGLR